MKMKEEKNIGRVVMGINRKIYIHNIYILLRPYLRGAFKMR